MLPGSPGTPRYSPVLPGRDHWAHRFCIGSGDSRHKGALTPPKWLFKRLNVNVLIPLLTGMG